IRVREVRVIEEVERLRTKLDADPVCDWKCFEERQIHLPEGRTVNEIASDCPKLTALRPRPRTARLAVGRERRVSRDKPDKLAGIIEERIAYQIRTAPTGVAVGIAIAIAGCDRLPAQPVIRTVHLPSAQNQVHGARGMRHQTVTLSNWQLIHRCDEEHLL